MASAVMRAISCCRLEPTWPWLEAEGLRAVVSSWMGTSVKDPDGVREVRRASGFSEESFVVAMLALECERRGVHVIWLFPDSADGEGVELYEEGGEG
jgi:hypothetical protein